jgi:putrescine transport system substrate-binding protein
MRCARVGRGRLRRLQKGAGPARFPRPLALAVIALTFFSGAQAQTLTPFVPSTTRKPKIVRLLAYPEFFDPHAFEAFEQATGYAVAYDAYSLALEIPDKWKDGPYDLVALPGPALAKRIAAGALGKLDKSRLPNARGVQGAVSQKLGAYDPTGAYGVVFGWAPYGLIYDAKKVPERLGAQPDSGGALLDPRFSRKLATCGVVAPNARDAMFVAAWRLLGVDPGRLRPLDVKSAAFLLARAKPAMQGFAVPDPIGALARGSDCLTLGTPGEAAAANARAKSMGDPAEIAFALPKEGGGVELEAFAIPRDAQNPELAYKLLDFLMKSEIAEADSLAAGLNSSESVKDLEMMKRLWPLGAFDDSFAQAIETEWTHVRTAK